MITLMLLGKLSPKADGIVSFLTPRYAPDLTVLLHCKNNAYEFYKLLVNKYFTKKCIDILLFLGQGFFLGGGSI